MLDESKTWFTEECTECATSLSWEVRKKLHEEQTPFQKIEIYSTKGFGNLMAIDGFVMLTERDNFIYHEMLAHLTLFSHADPANVVIVGGGDCGTLREVTKHTCLKKITQVEIDERVTRLAEKYFPALCEANGDPRVDLVFKDAVQWMYNVEDRSLDVIIVDSTDPIGPAKGLFSTSFYRDCRRALKDGGLLSQQSESPLIHFDTIIAPMRARMLEAGFETTKLCHFPQPSYPTGWWTVTMARKNGHVSFARERIAKQRPFSTRYYNHLIHRASFAPPQFLLKEF